MKKHKNYDCIVAWAEGKNIETSEDGLVWSYCQNPRWYEDMKYRVEITPIIQVSCFQLVQDFEFATLIYREFKPDLENWDLKITYQDGKAIKAELPNEN